jgi:NAD(P)-dependent dehydrogenase (short-subunit alcohol dehydrogenase family)
MSTILDLFKLDHQTAVVTGAAGLLGREFCRTLASAGANIIVADLDLNAAETVSQRLQQDGFSAIAMQCDVTKAASVEAMVSTAVARYGRLDILVNSAALDPKFDPENASRSLRYAGNGAFEDYPLQDWQQALDVNLTGAFLCCQAAVRPMLAQQHGVIINMCSIYGLTAPDQRLYQRPDQAPQFKPVYYSVTKAGILGLTRYLAAYYGDQHIRVNALTPGGVFNGHDETFVQAYAARAVLGRMAKKDEMNGALLFLASDASSYMTGANLVVDGGWTTW